MLGSGRATERERPGPWGTWRRGRGSPWRHGEEENRAQASAELGLGDAGVLEEVPRTQSGRDSFYGCLGEPLWRRQQWTFGQALQDEEELARDILGRKNGERWRAGDLMPAESSVPVL